ncbi:S41 family peptidase [Candidatus Cloacimonadota bacterium]
MKKIKYSIGLLALILLFSCEDLLVQAPDSDQHRADFEAAWNKINEVYPFFDFKQINWDSIYTLYLPKVEAARGDEFYLVLNDLLAELKDGHVYYHTDGGAEIYPFYTQRHFKDRHAYSPFVVRSYFEDELKVTASRSAEYGVLPGNIGYVFLSDFHQNYLMNEFPGILNYLKNTIGIIIDIRQKRGGDYQNVEAVVTRFMTEPLERPNLYFLDELISLPPFQPQGPFTYTNPVAVLINGSTFSAGEITTEILKQLPNVTAIGDTTGGGGGAGSDSGDYKSKFRLPSGKLISIPTGYFERYNGELIEWLGVPPDIYVEQTEEDINNGIDNVLEYAIDLITAKSVNKGRINEN